MPNFCGESKTYYGAYGYRLRNDGVDQVKRAYNALKNNPITRQVVLSIWNKELDLNLDTGQSQSLDIPCNIASLIKIYDNKLYWSQVMRSNDIFRGNPYNFIQFTILHDLFAKWLGLELGDFVLFIDNLHIYKDDINRCGYTKNQYKGNLTIDPINYEETMSCVNVLFTNMQMISKLESISENDLNSFVNHEFRNRFFNDVKIVLALYVATKSGFKKFICLNLSKISNKTLLSTMGSWIQARGFY